MRRLSFVSREDEFVNGKGCIRDPGMLKALRAKEYP